MGGHYHRRARGVHLAKEREDLPGQLGSKLPVGSSARRITGAVDEGAAMATRCCSPPESCSGKEDMRFWAHPAQGLEAPALTLLGGDALDGQHESHVFVNRPGGNEPEVLEHNAHAPPEGRHLAVSEASRFRPFTRIWPEVGRASRMTSLSRVLFPAPGRARDETELAWVDRQGHLVEGVVLAAVGLVHIIEPDHGLDLAAGGKRQAGAGRPACFGPPSPLSAQQTWESSSTKRQRFAAPLSKRAIPYLNPPCVSINCLACSAMDAASRPKYPSNSAGLPEKPKASRTPTR